MFKNLFFGVTVLQNWFRVSQSNQLEAFLISFRGRQAKLEKSSAV
jgi:hypothetical protein